jgi:hypothetical protein
MKPQRPRELPDWVDDDLVRASLREFRANQETLSRNIEALVAEHEDEWVVVHDGRFLFSPTLQGVFRRRRRRAGRWERSRLVA